MSLMPAGFDFTQLSVPDRLELINEIWDSIEEEDLPEPTDAQKEELKRRIDYYKLHPDEKMTLDEVKASFRNDP